MFRMERAHVFNQSWTFFDSSSLSFLENFRHKITLCVKVEFQKSQKCTIYNPRVLLANIWNVCQNRYDVNLFDGMSKYLYFVIKTCI